MPAFVPLLKNGLLALARAQEELHPEESGEALRAALKSARPQTQVELLGHPAAALAQDKYAGQLPGGLQLYHGSPHLFDEFDFYNNLSKGEGAQSFGPGGYLTGDLPLAEHYALSLAQRRRGNAPEAWHMGYAHDPQGFLEFLRARALSKGFGYGLSPEGGNWTWQPGYTDVPYPRSSSVEPKFVRGSIAGVRLQNAAPYAEAMRAYPNNMKDLLSARLTTPDAGKRSADLGRELLDRGNVLSEGAPQLSQKRLSLVPEDIDRSTDWRTRGAAVRQYVDEKLGLSGAPVSSSYVNITRNNLRAVQGAAEPGSLANPPKFKRSMKSTVPLSVLSNDLASLPRPRIYTATTPVAPSELFSYDDPLKVSSPRVVAALAQVAERLGLRGLPSDASFADITGSQFISALPQDTLKARQRSMDELRQAGVPGMYFNRAGYRGGPTSDTFDPSAKNFVWFDDPALSIKERIDKCAGGAVP